MLLKIHRRKKSENHRHNRNGLLPSLKAVTNMDLEKTIDTTDEWIFSKVGVKERRIASNQEATSDFALYAAQNAIWDAGIHAEDIDLIVLATCSPDMIHPLTAYSCSLFEMDQKHLPNDGVITGFGWINGRPVAVYSQDFWLWVVLWERCMVKRLLESSN